MAAILLQRCSALKHAGHYQSYAPCGQSVNSKGHVAATHPWGIFPQHSQVYADAVIRFVSKWDGLGRF